MNAPRTALAPPAVSPRMFLERMTRAAAGAVAIVAVLLCFRIDALSVFSAADPAEMFARRDYPGIFFLVACLCGAFVLFVRGLGEHAGAALGLVVGALWCSALARHSTVGPASQLLFVALGGGVNSLLGYLSGGLGDRVEGSTAGAACGSMRAAETPSESAAQASVVGAMAGEIQAWLATPHGERAGAVPSWIELDQFLREMLGRRLLASRVRLLRVSSDGARIDPIEGVDRSTRDAVRPCSRLLARVANTAECRLASDSVIAGGDSESDAACRWLLPLRSSGRTAAVVAIGDVGPSVRSSAAEPALAASVRDLLELLWQHVDALHLLRRHERTDCESGLLCRDEVLSRLRAMLEPPTSDAPFVILAIGVEGLRRLDDSGRWSERDAIIHSIAQTLQVRIRSDDLVGRFSDDRFVVVIRRVDAALGQRVAMKLLDLVRSGVLDAAPSTEVRDQPAVRAGLVAVATLEKRSDDSMTVESDAALERALALLDRARRQGMQIAVESGADALLGSSP